MPRGARHAPGGYVYHVLNRANGRLRLFKKPEDFLAFERVLKEAHAAVPIRILGWCVMSNHWHFVLWPETDGQLTAFMRKLTHTHAQRWKTAHKAVGHGHLYQGRFKSFPVQGGPHLLTLLRYVERNPLRARLVRRAEQWRWGSHHVRLLKTHALHALLAEGPVELPKDWSRRVHTPQTAAEQDALRDHVHRSRPLGEERWTDATARSLGLESSLRPRGRPVGWRKRKPKNR
jgi:putative transposase